MGGGKARRCHSSRLFCFPCWCFQLCWSLMRQSPKVRKQEGPHEGYSVTSSLLKGDQGGIFQVSKRLGNTLTERF